MIFKERSKQVEMMDDPLIAERSLQAVFKDINMVNSFLGGHRITLKSLERIFRDLGKKKYAILDVGCGDGDMLRVIARYFRQKEVDLDLTGMDISEQALGIARKRSAEFRNIKFIQEDINRMPTDSAQYDVVICSLTLHHFDDEQIPLILKNLSNIAQSAIVINDLQRSKLAYYLFKGFSTIFIKTEIAKRDGLVSIKSGFRRNDLEGFSRVLPKWEHEFSWKWLFRYLWVMRRMKLVGE